MHSILPLCRPALLMVSIGMAATASLVHGSDDTNRFNILFVAIDDLRPELGCYGVREAQSPSLDELARTAVLFDHHYVQVATCGASRYAMLTGRSPAQSRVTRSNTALHRGPARLSGEQQAGAQSLPELFRRSGYRTVCIGKISHTPDGRVFEYDGSGDGRPELPHAWDELPTPFGPWNRGWGAFFAYTDGRHREDGEGHHDLMEFRAEHDEDLPDGLLASAAIERLAQFGQSGERFFLGLGFYKPHLPFVATADDWQAFVDAQIPPPGPGKLDAPTWHASGEFYRYDFPFPKTRQLSPEAQQTARRAYYACVRYVDRQVGRVLAALDDLGLAEDTVVVVWGDHGWHLGEQQIWGKHTPLERATRSVLMVRAPGISQPGLVTDALVESIDLFPTLVELCRPWFTETHWPLDGKSLVPVLKGDAGHHREVAVSFWGDAVSVRSPTHRLVVSPTRDGSSHVELYDSSENPDETENIAQMHPEIVEALRDHVPQP